MRIRWRLWHLGAQTTAWRSPLRKSDRRFLVYRHVALKDALALAALAAACSMGWRSWNCYHGDVSQAKIEATIDAVVKKRAGGVSLLDLGFSDVGVDDGWQACGTGRTLDNHTSFHAADGTPLVNKTKFPSVQDMVAYGHKHKGLTMGW